MNTVLGAFTAITAAAGSWFPFFHNAAQTPLEVHAPAPVWQCDLAAWVAAPDLSPSTVIPGKARLVANGTDCRDIVGWGVGLHFKERAILRRQGKESEDATMDAENTLPEDDPLFGAPDGWASDLRHQPWDIRGVERVVFDTSQQFALDQDMWLDDEWLQAVQTFAVHMPNTNFPPLSKGPAMYGQAEGYQGLTDTEDLCEYYISVSLSNGTMLHVPAGKTGFHPNPEPTAPAVAVKHTEPEWPKELVFNAADTKLRPRDWSGPYGKPPHCDENDRADFTITLEPKSGEPIVQGTHLPLHVTIRRTSNTPAELPNTMFFYHYTRHNLTWARGQFDSEDEFARIENKKSEVPAAWAVAGGPERMRMVPGDKALIRNCTYPHHPATVRYRFDDIVDLTAERIEFDIEIPIGSTDMISFDGTFISHRSTLEMSLITRFDCPNLAKLPGGRSAAEDAVRAEAGSWVQHLVRPEFDEFKLMGRSRLAHHGFVDLNVKSSLPPVNSPLLHYLDPGALGPKISLSANDAIEYPPLGIVHPEPQNELRWRRYGAPATFCHSANSDEWYGACGGERHHTGRVWARQKALERGEDVYVPLDEAEYYRPDYW